MIHTIRQSDSAEAARAALTERFGLSEVQAQAILDMQLRRLAALERQRIEDEYQEIMTRIAYLEDLLAHEEKIRGIGARRHRSGCKRSLAMNGARRLRRASTATLAKKT